MWNRSTRGLFGWQTSIRIRDVTDGTSNTVMMSEGKFSPSAPHWTAAGTQTNRITEAAATNVAGIGNNPSLCLTTIDPDNGQFYRPGHEVVLNSRAWTIGEEGYISFNTVLPPNSPNCLEGPWFYAAGVFSASSRHPGGVNVLISDGSVQFVSENIDTGDLTAPEPVGSAASPYGVWGSLGSKSGGDIVGEF